MNTWQPWLQVALVTVVSAYVLGLWWFSRGLGPQPATGQGNPQITVVVAARDEEARIGALLDNLAAQTYPQVRWEVIVVYDGSADHTAALV